MLLLGISSSAFLLNSCAGEDSTDVNQDRIYAVYEIFYNKNTDKSRILARFRFGNPTGTLLELKGGSSEQVTFDGETLPYATLHGGHFKEVAGRVSGGDFEYTNADGKVFKNTVSDGDTAAFPSDFDTIAKSTAGSMTWLGNPVGDNEYIGLFIGTSWTWGDDALFVQALKTATDVVMGVQAKANLSTGAATAFMDRVMEKKASEVTTAGGVVRYRYRAVNQNVLVVD